MSYTPKSNILYTTCHDNEQHWKIILCSVALHKPWCANGNWGMCISVHASLLDALGVTWHSYAYISACILCWLIHCNNDDNKIDNNNNANDHNHNNAVECILSKILFTAVCIPLSKSFTKPFSFQFIKKNLKLIWQPKHLARFAHVYWITASSFPSVASCNKSITANTHAAHISHS